MSKLIFEEEQRFNQWWLWLLILGGFGVIIYLFISKSESSLAPLLFEIALFGIIILFILLIKLKTRIDENGVYVSFFPFISKALYTWDDIYSIKTTKYSPIGDYGGWGYRVSFKGKGKAFNIKGNKGIFLVTTDGKKRMIGTQKMEEAQKIIEQYHKSES